MRRGRYAWERASDRRRKKGFNPWRWAKARGMAGSLLFWLAIWGFTGFSSSVFPIFLAIAILTGLGWDKKRREGSSDDDDDDWEAEWDDEDEDDDVLDRRRDRAREPLDASRQEPAEAGPVEPPVGQALHARVIADAAPARASIKAAAAVASGELGQQLRRIVQATDDIVRGVEAAPERFHEVQRVFTYYLPSAADLIAARGSLVTSGDAARLQEVDGMIGRLDAAFADFVARLQGRDARAIEIDIRLLEQALDEEFAGKRKG